MGHVLKGHGPVRPFTAKHLIIQVKSIFEKNNFEQKITLNFQEFGGSPTLFGIASVINHLSEMAAYFYSFKIINKIGHVKVQNIRWL